MNAPNRSAATPSPLRQVLATQRPLFVRAAWFSLISGVLMLAPSWFMFEVYGRVLNSRNEKTLWMLLLMVVGVYAVVELLELVRGRILQKAGEAIDCKLRMRVFDIAFEANRKRALGVSMQAFGDLKTVRDFIPSPAVGAMLDAPAALVLLVLMFVMSEWLGLMTLVGAALQVAIAAATDRKTMPLLGEAMKSSMQAQGYATSTQRNAQVIESMGMLGSVHKRWMVRQRRFLARQAEASDHAGLNSVAAKLVQTMQGSLLLGAACWLVLHNALLGGAGMMIVASIVGARVLAPMAQLVAQWRGVVNVRDAYGRLDRLLTGVPEAPQTMPLPKPKGLLTVEAVHATAPGSPLIILRGVTFGARPGEVVAVVGPSASGKTTLARLLVGLWPAASGKVRLDGADVYSWNKAELGPSIGYLPQNVELFDGTVAENIARFGAVDAVAVRAAAELVGVVEIIEALPQGFDTRIGDDGAVLSGGQRQRLGLARAVYGDPNFLVLDEPNASLDEAGEQALLRLLQSLKARGATVVAITHRSSLLPAADKLLVMHEGQSAAFGPRDEVLAALRKANEQAAAKARPAQAAHPVPAPTSSSLAPAGGSA